MERGSGGGHREPGAPARRGGVTNAAAHWRRLAATNPAPCDLPRAEQYDSAP